MKRVNINFNFIVALIIFIPIMMISGCKQLLNAAVGADNISGQMAEDILPEQMYEITNIDRMVDGQEIMEIDFSKLNYEEDSLKIEQGGHYLLKGKNENCRIVICAYDDEIVHLILDNVEITSKSGPAIYVEKAGKVVITVQADTENIVEDGAQYMKDGEACIFSSCDLTINGNGTLNIYGYYHDAIRSKDRVKVIGTNLNIWAKNVGLRGNDGVLIDESTIGIESEGTGIKTNSEQGYVFIRGGVCKVVSGENAIYADRYVAVKDCKYDFYSVMESIRCNGIKEIEEDN